MFAREWKTKCPKQQQEAFIRYLYQTGVEDAIATVGFKGVQILVRDQGASSEITLITYWNSLEAIKKFAGEDIGIARLYPEDYKYDLEPDNFVRHYKVIENQWL